MNGSDGCTHHWFSVSLFSEKPVILEERKNIEKLHFFVLLKC